MRNVLSVLLFCLLAVNLYVVKAQTRCSTPNKEQASCVAIQSCPILYNAVLTNDNQVIKFLRESQCGFNGGPLVCCGSRASYAPILTPTTLVRRPELLPTLNQCGALSDNKILNGQDTDLNEFPWTILIRYRNSSGYEQFSCGGSLISQRYVVTAAHCVVGRILSAIGSPTIVRLGEWNTETDPDCVTSAAGIRRCSDKPIDVGIESTTAHSEYVDGSADRYHDIALIRLDRPVQFTAFIKPVCLPPENERVTIGEQLIVVGWGRTEKGRFSAIKQKLSVPVVEQSRCGTVFRSAGVRVGDTQLCAGAEKGKDSCNGDSGGPLLGERNAQYFLEGVVSFGADCGREGWPGIYTRIPKYRDWIEGNLVE